MGGNRRRPAQAANRCQSERYAFFVAAAVEASIASSRARPQRPFMINRRER